MNLFCNSLKATLKYLQIPGNGRFQHKCHQTPVRWARLLPKHLHSVWGKQLRPAANSHLKNRATGNETERRCSQHSVVCSSVTWRPVLTQVSHELETVWYIFAWAINSYRHSKRLQINKYGHILREAKLKPEQAMSAIVVFMSRKCWAESLRKWSRKCLDSR